MKLSIVIPTLDEATHLTRALGSLPADAEVVVADGGSRDGTVAIARRAGAKVVTGVRGRGAQMNLGARAATGEVFLFLHADCALAGEASAAIEKALEDPRVVGGSFRLVIHPDTRALRLIAWGSNLRARLLGTPYGDQGLFVRRGCFEKVSGFDELPLMEDVAILRRLRHLGRLVQLETAIATSPRHWQRRGPWTTTGINWLTMSLYWLGVSPGRLAPLYRRWRKLPAHDTGGSPQTPDNPAEPAQPEAGSYGPF